jgi:hypothetical protein
LLTSNNLINFLGLSGLRRAQFIVWGFPQTCLRPCFGFDGNSTNLNLRIRSGPGSGSGFDRKVTAPTNLVSPKFRAPSAIQARVPNLVVGKFEENSSIRLSSCWTFVHFRLLRPTNVPRDSCFFRTTTVDGAAHVCPDLIGVDSAFTTRAISNCRPWCLRMLLQLPLNCL